VVRFRSLLVLIVSIASSAITAYSSYAAGAAETGAALEEITVTATRRETSLQKTPIAVTALSVADIAQANPRDLGDLAKFAPGLSASRITAFNAASFAIRGVGQTDIIVYQEAPVSVVIDDVVLPSTQTQLLDTFDLERVEILRGPQGTTFGKNTTGGAVNIVTKRPNLTEFGGQFQVDGGSYGRVETKAAFDVPLVNDKFGLRFVGKFTESDGYYKNGATWGPIFTFRACNPAIDPPTCPGIVPTNIPGLTGESGAGDGKRIGGENVGYGRLKALWKASDSFTALFQFELLRDRSDAVPSFNDTRPAAPYLWNLLGLTQSTGDPLDHMASTERNDLLLNMGHGQRVDVNGYYANLDWDLGGWKLSSVSAYREQEERLPNTYTGAVPETTSGEKISLFDATRDTDRNTLQQEVRLASSSDGPLNYVLGAFYQKDTTKFCVLQVLGFIDFTLDSAAVFGDPLFFNHNPQILCNRQDATSYAGFADLTWKASDRLTFGAGARWTHEKKEWAGRNQRFVFALGPEETTLADLSEPLDAVDFGRWSDGVVRDSHSWSEPTWRLLGSYQVTDDWNTYLRFDRGFRSGGYNDQVGTSGNPIADDEKRPTNPEFANSVELGSKLEALDKRLRFNAALFYVKYKDAQRALNSTVTNAQGTQFQQTLFFNAADATVKGVELELLARPNEAFTVGANFTWQDAKYDKFQANTDFDETTQCSGCPAGIDIVLSGLPITRAPKTKGAIFGNYRWNLGSGALELTGSVAYEARNIFYYSDAGRAFDAFLDQKTLLDASVQYTAAEDRWFIKAYGKNLGDKRYRIASQSVATLWTHTQFGEPRAFGLQAGINFGAH
jgi:iron complex outermembrane receptor protein